MRFWSDWIEASEAGENRGALVEFVIVVVVVVVNLGAEVTVTVHGLQDPAVIERGIDLVILPVFSELLHRPVNPVESHIDWRL